MFRAANQHNRDFIGTCFVLPAGACTVGPDPLATSLHHEVQVFRCDYPSSTPFQFRLFYNGELSRLLSASSSAAEIRAALVSFRGIYDANVIYNSSSTVAESFCEDADGDLLGETIIELHFLSPALAYVRAPVLTWEQISIRWIHHCDLTNRL